MDKNIVPIGVDEPFENGESSTTTLSEESLTALLRMSAQHKQEDKQANNAVFIFKFLAVLLVISIIASVILHVMKIEIPRVLDTVVLFSQGAITTILGFLFGKKH